MFFTLEKLTARAKELEKRRYTGLQPITPLEAMEGELGPDEIYQGCPPEVRGGALSLEDEFSSRDRYLWARKTLTLPPVREGCSLVGLFDFGNTGHGHNSGFESLLYVDGQPYQGVDGNHKDVLLEALAGRQVTLTFLLWTGLEGGGPRTVQRHRVRMAHVGYLHKAVDRLYYLSRAICETVRLLPDTAEEGHELTGALNSAFHLIDWDGDRFYDTASQSLDRLLDALDRMEKKSGVTVGAVGHTHIDLAWLWRIKHTHEKAQRSFATVLRLMEEYDEYIFLQSQPQAYQFVKQDCPALYERIRERVREGRWEADGGMWVEADCNLSSGEALVRQLLLGIEFFRDEFGVSCEFLWLPDVFGYSWALPQILKLCNIRTFMTTKISWNQYNTIPHDLFRWRGIDGSEILTYFITTPGDPVSDNITYNGLLDPFSVLGSRRKFKDRELSRETLISYGYGDGGGGVNREMLEMRRAMDRLPGLPAVKTTRAGDFFRRLHASVDSTDRYVHTWDGELYLEYHRGTYTSQGYNKRMNRELEFALSRCEWLCCQSLLRGGSYPAQEIQESWEALLLQQFHDIIPGSSIREVYEDSVKIYGELASTVRRLDGQALGAVTVPAGDAYTLYHMGSFDRREAVALPETRDGVFTAGDGSVLPAQRTPEGWLVLAELPALSCSPVRFTPGASPEAPVPFTVKLAERTLETPFYRLRWDEQGRVCGLWDRENGREALREPGNVLEVYEDKPIHYDNWDIDLFHTEKREVMTLLGEPELLECGPLRAVLRFRFGYGRSVVTQELAVYGHSRRIDFVTHADWHENRKLLKAAFPVDTRSTKAADDIQFGHVERPTHWNTSWDWARFEVVGHKWADLSEEGYGVSLLNNCKYGYSVKDHVMRLTLLKSGKFPDTEADMGEHFFTYSLLPHAGGVMQGDTLEESVLLNLPAGVSPGLSAEGAGRLLRFTQGDVVIDAVKKAQKEDCLVVRLHECRGGRALVELCSDYGVKSFAPCNLLEENLEAPVEGAEIRAELRPFEIRCYKLWF